uniref:TGF-beta family profile domain-containing protein n=1 Tax=Gouania willdenowi TaxID=441366 RepID=A0A8C5ES65_GOUWI
MRAACSEAGLLRFLTLTCLLYLLWFTCSCAASGRRPASHRTLRRSRRSHRGSHHRPLTDEQKADQNLQFMLSLYRSAAEPDGRPKQHRKFGSNTVRLLRPSASSVHYLPASGDHCYTFTVQYNLDTLPSERLIRASFIHLRSCPPTDASQAVDPPRCRAQITSLGAKSLVTLEPHERWIETDITTHVSGHFLQGNGPGEAAHLTLTAQYWCKDPGRPEEGSSLSWWLQRVQGKQWNGEPHLEVPSLLLYLEEERKIGRWHPSVRRRHFSLDALKNARSSSSFSTSSFASIISDIPLYKRKTGTPKNLCKLHSFRLSFDELGLGHYFIAPPVYNPRFCQGDCPRVLHYGYHSPNHAFIQTAINELGIGDVPPPSCVPYKYMPMSVLVVHKKRVDYRELEDMVAESCTCR